MNRWKVITLRWLRSPVPLPRWEWLMFQTWTLLCVVWVLGRAWRWLT